MHAAELLFWAIALLALSVGAAPQAYDGPKTFDELKVALTDLGIKAADAIPKPAEAAQIEARTKAPSKLCYATCGILELLLGDITSQVGDVLYTNQQNRYWSLQQLEVQPACRVAPKKEIEVAATLLITSFFQCPFAVKSGGHAAFKGASNIEGGVTIDLVDLNKVQVSADKKTTQVGTGNRWLDVYSKLDKQGLSVVGGRVADIGVGGLTLGGGISFFSGRYGWACDGIRNYQTVLANGKIVDVNHKSYPDLYFALRGGGNNFGIVTRLDMETFPQGKLWGGMTVHAITEAPAIYKAFYNFNKNAPKDPDAALIVAAAFAQGSYVFSNDYEYAKPIAAPPIFSEFAAIPNLTTTNRITTLSDLTIELNASNPSGFRETYTTATFRNDNKLQERILQIFQAEIDKIKDAKDILPALVMQPITLDVITKFSKNGGNALGIAPADGPLILMNLAILWTNKSDDERIIRAADAIVKASIAEAKKRGKDFRYVYQNYASLGQSVFEGYGKKNQDRLIAISRKYDPKQIFQKLQPGYFKLSGNNGGSPT